MTPRQPQPRVGGPKAVQQYSRSHSERAPAAGDRERQRILMEYYRQKFEGPVGSQASVVEVAARPAGTDAAGLISSENHFPHAAAAGLNSSENLFGLASISSSPEWGDDESDCESLLQPATKESFKLPAITPISVAAPPATLAAPILSRPASEARETQRLPWRQQISATDEAAQTQRQFYSPRAREASLPPMVSIGSSSPSRQAKASPRRRPPVAVPAGLMAMPSMAIGAPLSPLGVDTRARRQQAEENATTPPSLISAGFAVKDPNVMHSSLLPAAPPTALVKPPARRPPVKPPAIFGSPGKASSIGALLGELDSRHETLRAATPSNDSEAPSGRGTPISEKTLEGGLPVATPSF